MIRVAICDNWIIIRAKALNPIKCHYCSKRFNIISKALSSLPLLFLIEFAQGSTLRRLNWNFRILFNLYILLFRNNSYSVFFFVLLDAHEKIFIMFMVSSLTYMLVAVKLGRLVTPNAQSLHYKQILFVTSLISTVGLIIFFLKHRLLCHDLGKSNHTKTNNSS